jgi:hypothetical protein
VLTHEHSVVARIRQYGRIGWARNSRFSYSHNARGHLRRHPHGPVGIDSKGHEVSLVHADQISASGNGTIEFGFIVNLDKCIKPDGMGQLQKRFEFGLVESGGDEQHAVGSHDAGIAHVASTDGEVFAQDRERARGAGGNKIFD